MSDDLLSVEQTLRQIHTDYVSKNLDGNPPALETLADDYGIPYELVIQRAGSENWIIERNDAKETYRQSLRKARQQIVNTEVVDAVKIMGQLMRERIGFVVDCTPKINAQLFMYIDKLDEEGNPVLKFGDLIKLKDLLNKEAIDIQKTLRELQEQLDGAGSQQSVDEWKEKLKVLAAYKRSVETKQIVVEAALEDDPLYVKLDKKANG